MKYQPPFDPALGGVVVDGIHNTDDDAGYTNGNPSTGQEGSIPPAEAFEHPQREIVNILTWAGIEPSHANLTQLKDALRWLVGTRLVKSIGGGVPLYDGLDDVLECHRMRSIEAGTNIRFELIESPVGSGQHKIKIHYDSSGTGVGSGGISGISGTCNPVSKLILTYTGADQVITVPAGATYMWCKLWGAGTSYASIAPDAAAGGFTEGWFAVTAGTKFVVVVGQGGAATGSTTADGVAGVGTYGFGGAADNAGNTTSQGGGLTGIFTGDAAVLATDTSRALAIAGGGATGDTVMSTTIAGERGNGVGGQPTMQGIVAANSYVSIGSGGGGGYSGGALSKGGSGFLHASKLSGTIHAAAGSGDTPDGASDVDYVAPLGAASAVAYARGQHGLAVVRFLSGTCP